MTDNRILYPQQPIIPLPAKPSAGSSPRVKQDPGSNGSFRELLTNELNGVKFSQHALNRLQSRNINLTPDELEKLNRAVDKAAGKGARESLILFDNKLALVVSVKNRTVITAMNEESIRENVFTNIDSAVII